MDHLSEYKEKKNRICQLLNDTADYIRSFGEERATKDAANLEQISADTYNGKFSIIVAGQFSSGKSTFLNALMGERYLPSYTKETTATVNILKSVDESPTKKPAVVVNYKNGKSKTFDNVSLETITKYVSTDGDDVVNNVKSVEIYLDSPFLNEGVRLIDTPGLNGIAEGHADITKTQFGQAHAAIFMFCAAAPGTSTDFDILKEMKGYGNSIIFVLNRIDDIKKAEGETPESVISNLRTGYASKFENDALPEIWPVSSYKALISRSKYPVEFEGRSNTSDINRIDFLDESRIEAFEERLMRYLTQGERTKDELVSPLHQLEAILNNIIADYSDQIQLLDSGVSSEELLATKSALEEEIQKIKNKINDDKSFVLFAVQDTLTNAEDAIRGGSREIKTRYLDKLESSAQELEDFEAHSRSFIRRMEREYSDLIQSNVEEMEKQLRNLVKEKFFEYSSIVSTRLSQRKHADSFSVDSFKINDSIFQLDIDIDKVSEDLDKFYDRQTELSYEISEEEYNRELAQANESKIDQTEREMKDARQRHQEIINNLGLRPSADQRTRIITKKKGGIVGLGKWIRTGSREYQTTESYLDTSRQVAYDRRVRELSDASREEMNEYQMKLDNLRNQDTNSALHQANIKKTQIELQRVEREIKRLEEKRIKDIEKGKRNRLRAAKSYVEDCLNDIDKNNRDEGLRILREQESPISDMITAIISDIVTSVISEKQQRLDNVIQTLTEGKLEADKKIEMLRTRSEELRSLNGKAVDLRREIEDAETDMIETVAV